MGEYVPWCLCLHGVVVPRGGIDMQKIEAVRLEKAL